MQTHVSVKSPKGTRCAKKRPAAKESAREDQVRSMKRPASNVAMKRPAAKTAAVDRTKETKKTRQPRAASVKAEKSGKAKKPFRGKITRNMRREALLRTVPSALKRRYAKGCSKCRHRALCTVSCWAARGFVVP